MKNSNKKILFYSFIIANILLVAFLYFNDYDYDLENLRYFLSTQHFVISYGVYIFILIVRGLTLLPGTAFLLIGIYLFSFFQVFFAIQIAIVSYCLIIYNFSHKMHFKIPQKILNYESKIKARAVPIIFAMCFIPGVSINILIYFLSILNIKLKSILIGIIAGTSITSAIYISIIKGLFNTGDYF
jgi:uncharacterized membrane protein YdjX (TVP38/TMEM64 family)